MSVLSGHDQDEVIGRLLQRLQEGIGRLFVGPVELVDEEDPPVAAPRLELRATFEQAHLLDRDLAQRPVGRKRHEVRMRSQQQRLLAAPLGGPLLALLDHRDIVIEAQVVLLDRFPVAQQARRQRAGQRSLAHALRTGQQQRLGNAFLLNHAVEGRGNALIAVEAFKHGEIR